jgi:hypothetical protein
MLLVEVSCMLMSFAFMQSSGATLSLAIASRSRLTTYELYRSSISIAPDLHFTGILHQRY